MDIKCKNCGKELKVNRNNVRPEDAQLIAQALDKARPYGLEAELVWSLTTHFKTYPYDDMKMGLTVALDDWDL